MPERLNFGEAVRRAGVSRQRLNQAIASGRLPAERGGGPGKPTYIQLEDLQTWCVSEGLAMPLEAVERSERLKPEDLPVFLDRFRSIVEAMERLERTVEQAIERFERSQVQAVEQGIAQAITQLKMPTTLERSETSSDVLQSAPLDRKAIIARIQHAKDVEKKSYQQIASELNQAGIVTFSGKGVWQKGSVERFYKGKTH